MKLRLSICFILTVLLCSLAIAQENIMEIRTEFARITQKVEGGWTEELVYECPEYPEFGSITWHFESGNLIKISYSHGYEHLVSTTDYYFKDGNLFFIFYHEGVWYFNEGKTWGEADEYRFYFVNNEPIKCLHKHVKSNGESSTNSIPNEELDCALSSTMLKDLREELEFVQAVRTKGLKDNECILPDLQSN